MSRMKFLLLVGVVGVAWCAGAVHAARAQQPTSTWGGVYTEAQSKLGQETYTKVCAECHGQDLNGDGTAPALKGPDFLANWNGLTLADLFDRIRVSMPPTDPESVTAKQKIDVMAFLLKEAGFPAGSTELPATMDALKPIKIEATKPGR